MIACNFLQLVATMESKENPQGMRSWARLCRQLAHSARVTISIAIPFFSCSYEQTTRFLRDYVKKSASLPWSFGATEFSRNGFKPCHPLGYYCHI